MEVRQNQNTLSTTFLVKKSLPKKTIVFNSYWKFACERQSVFLKRLAGIDGPWTDDAIISEFKFTNTYRASDRVSQYLIKSVIYNGSQNPADILHRILLFKIFNKIETWEKLEDRFGEITVKNFSVEKYNKLFNEIMGRGESIYSGAYIMPSGGSIYPKKHLMHLNLLKKMLSDNLAEGITSTKSMSDVFTLLRSYPTIGDFLAYQFTIDINYSSLTNFSEMDFVVPGPGALNGLRKCFSSLGDFNESDAIRYVTDNQEKELDRLGLTFDFLGGRMLQLIDCQNIFCETDKYARKAHPTFKGVTDRMRIKQKFTTHGDLEAPFYPPKWKVNDRIVKQISQIKKMSKLGKISA